jgi:hypothetical protein
MKERIEELIEVSGTPGHFARSNKLYSVWQQKWLNTFL